MDSSLEINNKVLLSKEYVDQNSIIFEKVLSELESITKVAKDTLSRNVLNNGKVDNALLEKFQHEAHGFKSVSFMLEFFKKCVINFTIVQNVPR